MSFLILIKFKDKNIDGGIIQDGNALDAITYAFEYKKENEVI